MIPDIKKILYATDLSENARFAFGYAASIAFKYGAEITILHVLEEVSPGSAIRLAYILGEERVQELQEKNRSEVVAIIRGRLEKFCDEMAAELEECPFQLSEILFERGNTAQEIIKQSEKGNFDLIVMGSHGHSVLSDAMMGNTARRVVRNCSRPVLVIRLPK